MELLSPAGNYSAFIGAINAGCDAVYLGGSKFGARAYADNFSDEEIIKAIRVSKIYNVKVYLTVNTLIKEREFATVVNYIKPFYEAGLDGCIVQDIGLIACFNKQFPGLECHVSTQAFSTSVESVRLYKGLGAKRVVLARELSLKEIKDIKKSVDIEIETFIHGSMCYSYSGQCLFSSCLGGRSGNRGRCAGPCRLPYSADGTLNDGRCFPLSMKDQCTLYILPQIIEAGVDSLKIEGRMKKPEYSAFVTAIYRKYIDLYKENPLVYKVDKKDIEDLRAMYLRSEIGEGYYNKRNGKDMISLDSPSYSGNSDKLMEETKEKYLCSLKRKKVSVYVYFYKNNNMILTLTAENGISVSVTGASVLEAKNRPMSAADIEKQVTKFGDSCFEAADCFVDTDNEGFVPVSMINDLRRKAVSELEDSIIENSNVVYDCSQVSFDIKDKRDRKLSFERIISVSTLEQYHLVCNELKEFRNYIMSVPLAVYRTGKIKEDNILISLPAITRNEDLSDLKKEISFLEKLGIKGVISNNFEQFNILKECNPNLIVIAGSSLYAFNKSARDYICSFFDSYIYPLELSRHEIKELGENKGFLFAYGKVPIMQTANCVYKTMIGCNKNKGNEFLYLNDRKNSRLPVQRHCDECYNTIYNSVATCLFDEKSIFSDYMLYISFTDEDNAAVRCVLNGLIEQNKPEGLFTKAYWNKGVE